MSLCSRADLDDCLPFMGRIRDTSPPGADARAGGNAISGKRTILCRVPLSGDLRKRLTQRIPNPITLSAARPVNDTCVDCCLPFVLVRAETPPPDALVALRADSPRIDPRILSGMPLGDNLWKPSCERFIRQRFQAGAIRTSVPLNGPPSNLGLPFVLWILRATPPKLGTRMSAQLLKTHSGIEFLHPFQSQARVGALDEVRSSRVRR